MSQYMGVYRSGCMWSELQMQSRLSASDWITVSSGSHSVDFSLSNSVCFDNLQIFFSPLPFSFCTSLVRNHRDYQWRQTDIDIIGDSPAHACSHGRCFVTGGSALAQSSCLHAVAQFHFEILLHCVAPTSQFNAAACL